MNSRIIGIDLGTTNTVVAAVNPAGHTEILRTREGESLIPSVVLFDDEKTIVGREAQLRGRAHPDRLAACAKRLMGTAFYDHPIGGESIPPEVIQACILQQVKREWVSQDDRQNRAVIAVPAHFNEAQRHATTMAAEMSGLRLLELVTEPIAAALAFAEDAPMFSIVDSQSAPRAVLVFDLGGYTFEATLLSIRPGEMTMVATDHDSFLGGHDWDLRLVDMLAEAFIRGHGVDPRDEPRHLDHLVQRAIQFKHALGVRSHASAHLVCGGKRETVRITRPQFESATADLVEQTGLICDRVLQRGGVPWPRVTQVLLVGGATRMPMIRQMLARRLGRDADDRVCPEEAVARGAAIYAARAIQGGGTPPALQVTSTSTHSLGIEGVNDETGKRVNKVLIPKGTPLPATVTREFFAKRNPQGSIVFNVLEGENSQPDKCVKIGMVILRDLPAEVSEQWPVEVTYEYTPSGRLSVDARARYTNCCAHLTTVRAVGVSQAHVARWKKVITAQSGLPEYRQVLAWERSVESPPPVVVAGLPEPVATPEPEGVLAFLRRLMPFIFQRRQPAEESSADPARESPAEKTHAGIPAA